MSKDNVISIHEDTHKSLFGPVSSAATCVVEGRSIPRLGVLQRGENVEIILDGRLAIDVPNSLAHQVAWLVANALAIGEGYPFLGAETKERPFAPKIFGLEGLPK